MVNDIGCHLWSLGDLRWHTEQHYVGWAKIKTNWTQVPIQCHYHLTTYLSFFPLCLPEKNNNKYSIFKIEHVQIDELPTTLNKFSHESFFNYLINRFLISRTHSMLRKCFLSGKSVAKICEKSFRTTFIVWLQLL